MYNINLCIKRGEKLLVVGQSGCGKSTLAHCINGLAPASYPGEMTGKLSINGRDVKEMSIFDISKIVGTVLQDSDGQFIGLTVAEDIAFALENDCIPTQEMHRQVESIAKLVDVERVLGNEPHEISGGQKQRVSLGGVMVEQVDVLLFDEPLANLDPATGKQAIALIDDICKRTGCAVIIIEHRLEDVLYRDVDRVVLMGDGRILYDGSADKLLCSDLLRANGIREPLYVTALKYAGVTLSEDMHPSSLSRLSLSDAQIEQVREWFASLPTDIEEWDGKVILDVNKLCFSYNGTNLSVDGVSTRIYKGEMTSIVGTNGAGKSTLSKLICGFEKQQSGSIKFNGMSLDSLSIKERADYIGYVMQNPNQMISKVAIFDEIALGLRNRGVGEEEVHKRVEECLRICGLYPFRNWPISALSYGQKKRVTIASILVLKPEIIILDEPTAGQDLQHYTEIMDFLSELNKSGITVLLITHDMHLMLEYTERSLVLDNGKLISDCSPAELLTYPALVKRANLKETSLYHLAKLCGIDSSELTRRFIAVDREVRS